MGEDKEQQQLKKRLMELAERSFSHSVYTFTSFLSLSQQQVFYDILNEVSYAGYSMEGGCPLCERKMIRFGSEAALGYVSDYPIVCLRVEPLSPKFAQQLTHRDYLGAVMNLGIERETVGDIFVQEKAAVLFCQESIASYLVGNLDQVKHTRVKCSVTEVTEELRSPVLESLSLSVASPRIDGVVSKLYNIARSQSLELFRTGRVFVDGRLMENNSYILKNGNVITVRGFGKFIYSGEQGETRKGKTRICVEVYK